MHTKIINNDEKKVNLYSCLINIGFLFIYYKYILQLYKCLQCLICRWKCFVWKLTKVFKYLLHKTFMNILCVLYKTLWNFALWSRSTFDCLWIVTLLNKNRNTDNFVVNWKGTAYNTFKCLSLPSPVSCDTKRSKVHVSLHASGLSFARTLAFFLISTCLLSVFKLLRFNEYIQLFVAPTQEVTN